MDPTLLGTFSFESPPTFLNHDKPPLANENLATNRIKPDSQRIQGLEKALTNRIGATTLASEKALLIDTQATVQTNQANRTERSETNTIQTDLSSLNPYNNDSVEEGLNLLATTPTGEKAISVLLENETSIRPFDEGENPFGYNVYYPGLNEIWLTNDTFEADDLAIIIANEAFHLDEYQAGLQNTSSLESDLVSTLVSLQVRVELNGEEPIDLKDYSDIELFEGETIDDYYFRLAEAEVWTPTTLESDSFEFAQEEGWLPNTLESSHFERVLGATGQLFNQA